MYGRMDDAEASAAQVARIYAKASADIVRRMRDVFQVYQDKWNLTEKEARQLLSRMDGTYNPESLRRAISVFPDGDLKRRMLRDLETPAYQARLKRLQELQDQIDQMMADVYRQDRKRQREHYIQAGADAYYRGIYDVQRQVGFQFSFAHIDRKAFDRLLKSKWSGKNYSNRIWDNTRRVANTVKDELMLELLTGKKLDDCAEAIQYRFQVGAYQSRRIIRTESNFVSGQMQLQSYKECESEYYEYVATLDSKTDEECGALDGKRFRLEDAQPGVNMHPMHPHCRCTTVIVLDDDVKAALERRARDPKTGKNIKVPASTNYMQWARDNGLKVRSRKVIRPPSATAAAVAAGVVMATGAQTAKTAQQARELLKDEVGFDQVESSFSAVDDDLTIAVANQLAKLEAKFNIIHQSSGEIMSKRHGSAIAFIQCHLINPGNQDLSLSPESFRSKARHLSSVRSNVRSHFFMPCADNDEALQVYAVTHEYGHMIHNILIRDEMKVAGWDEQYPDRFVDWFKRTDKARYKWYSDIRNKSLRKWKREITQKAKKLDPDFDLDRDLSEYGKSSPSEFFAEVFANSQLGKPNALGDAMNEWLKDKGLVK